MNGLHRLATASVVLSSMLASGASAFESGRIQVEVSGTGPAVILVPGINSSPEVWSGLVESLDDREIHLVQVNGFGGLPDGENATGEVLVPVAEEIARYIAEEDLEEVALIGHSFGGLLAILVTARQPDAVDRLMVVDIPAYFGEIMGMPADQIVPVAEHLRSEALARDRKQWEEAELSSILAGVHDEDARALVIEDMRASDPGVGAQAQYDMMVADLRPELYNVTAKTTVVFVTPAAAPDMTPAQIAGFYAAQYGGAPDLSLEFVADSGHYVMLDQPERFGTLVRQFLE